MLLDGYMQFSTGQVLTSTADSTNVLDMNNARDLGIGEDNVLRFYVTTGDALLSAGSTTLVVAISGSTDASTWTVMMTSTTFAKANITAAGTRIWSGTIPRPIPGQALPRYFKLVYTVATGPWTAGSVNAGIVLDESANVQYPAAITVAN